MNMATAIELPTIMDAIGGETRGMMASVDQVDRWLAVAKPGDRIVYATRAFLPAKAPGPARMRACYELGIVTLMQKRSDLLIGEFNYIAQRTARPIKDLPIEGPQHPRAARSFDDEAAVIDRVLPILQRAARFDRPCPTDAQIAKRAAIDESVVRFAIEALRRTNVIRVHPAKAPTLRQVVIVATGHKTGMAA